VYVIRDTAYKQRLAAGPAAELSDTSEHPAPQSSSSDYRIDQLRESVSSFPSFKPLLFMIGQHSSCLFVVGASLEYR
jgi:hypothetical protein